MWSKWAPGSLNRRGTLFGCQIGDCSGWGLGLKAFLEHCLCWTNFWSSLRPQLWCHCFTPKLSTLLWQSLWRTWYAYFFVLSLRGCPVSVLWAPRTVPGKQLELRRALDALEHRAAAGAVSETLTWARTLAASSTASSPRTESLHLEDRENSIYPQELWGQVKTILGNDF